jgi:hypothetical protein
VKKDRDQSALRDCLISPNEGDRNGEAANVVDGLFAIARALDRLASAVEEKEPHAACRSSPALNE